MHRLKFLGPFRWGFRYGVFTTAARIGQALEAWGRAGNKRDWDDYANKELINR